MINFNYIELEQPIGTLYLGKMMVSDILEIAESKIRTPYNSRGIQRHLDENRAKKISRYAENDDAIFPTPIVLSASSKMVEFKNNNEFIINSNYRNSCSIVDGQHRLRGIEIAGLQEKFILPVVFIFDTYLEQDAEIFAAINGNQKPVSKSLVYDLYGMSDKRTVQKTCHEIVESLNSDEDSLLRGKIKMLGIKDETNPNASVSQATMIDSLMNYITNDPDRDNQDIQQDKILESLNEDKYIFRKWFVEDKDYMILKVIRSFFNGYISALKTIYDDNSYPSFFDKSIGYMAGFYLIKPVYELGIKKFKSAKSDVYEDILREILTSFSEISISNPKTYSSSASGAKQLYRDMLEVSINNHLIPIEVIPYSDKKYFEEKRIAINLFNNYN